ncbi:MAG: segregation/condensation protein A [Planctomycetaceae bacterium]|nr:segregation/condensation protein A [Planctomycetaceae bacterium]
MSAAYRVELDVFSGPLDLLLYLVRRSELDIVDLPITTITVQFEDFLSILQVLDLDLVGDFVVMASTLIEIKSRMVLPTEEEEAVEEEGPPVDGDPRSDLVRQLIEYKRFKEAALRLEEKAQAWQERYPRLESDRPVAGKDPAADRIKEVELWDLVSALGRILRQKEVEEEGSVKEEDTPLHVFVDQIGTLVRQEQEVRFSTLFDAETSRNRVVGMFLAILELLRHHHFRAEQLGDYGDIIIRPPLDESPTLPTAMPEAAEIDELPPDSGPSTTTG